MFDINGPFSKCKTLTQAHQEVFVCTINVNDFLQGLHCSIKLFADDSLFSVIRDCDNEASKLNNDVVKLQDRANT